jgi:phosphomannomutase
VTARPSGTEPKLKLYVELKQAVGPEGLEAARDEGRAGLERLKADVLEQARVRGLPTSA